MKTPMQELLERVKEYRDSETLPLVISRLNSLYVDIVGMLEKEKEVMESSWNDGHQVGRFEGKEIADEGFSSFEFYYNETFKTKKK